MKYILSVCMIAVGFILIGLPIVPYCDRKLSNQAKWRLISLGTAVVTATFFGLWICD